MSRTVTAVKPNTPELSENKVLLFGLVSGEQIIATVANFATGDEWVSIRKPQLLVPTQDPQGRPTLALARWLGGYSTSQTTPPILNISCLSWVAEPTAELASAYQEATSSLVVATSGNSKKVENEALATQKATQNLRLTQP